jgi:hypothetical protein
MRRSLCALALAAALTTSAHAACLGPDRAATVAEVVERVHAQHLKYLFVGEQHGAGPVKRFAVDLVNALVDAGDDVGLYVEGFSTACRPADRRCDDLARLFNAPAFSTLLSESKAIVHPIDPIERDHRARRMAATIKSGTEAIRVVLVGRVHVLYADDAAAELRVYGGGMRYPDPGDLVEAFPRRQILTVGLETANVANAPYRLLEDGCASDYVLAAPDTRDYWSATVTAQSMPSEREGQPAGQ